jgi:hypothetical protein
VDPKVVTETPPVPNPPAEGATIPAPPAKEEPKQSAATQATIPPEVLAEIQSNILKEAEKIAEAKGQKLLGEQRDRILQAMGGGQQPVDQTAVLKALLSNPVDVLTSVAERTRDITKRELADEMATREAEQAEDRLVARELLKDRPDITGSDESIEVLNLYFERSDPKKSKKERMAEAIRKHDLFMEKSGAGSKDERVKRVQKETATVPGVSGSGVKGKGGGDFYERQKSALESYKAERAAQFKVTHRGRKPVANY